MELLNVMDFFGVGRITFGLRDFIILTIRVRC